MLMFEIPLNNGTTDQEAVEFINKMTELYKRFKNGTISPKFTLQALQNATEGKYPFQTKFGGLKLFGPSINTVDKYSAIGHSPDSFFRFKYADFTERELESFDKKYLPLFTFFDEEKHQEIVPIAPYRFTKSVDLVEMIDEVITQDLYPNTTLHHIQGIMHRYLSGAYGKKAFFEGNSGNYFLTRDKNGEPWFVWLWLHNNGQWSYRLHKVVNETNYELKPHAYIWLAAPLGVL